MALASGKYLAKTAREVVIWPSPDADGDGPEVWVERNDEHGRPLERNKQRDAQNRIVKEYFPPEGFENRPGFDHTDNYVQVDSRGTVVRQPNGEAICIKPGRAVVYNPDGTVEYLDDEYSQHVFGLAHDSTSESDESEETEEERDLRMQEEKAARVAELQRQLEEEQNS